MVNRRRTSKAFRACLDANNITALAAIDCGRYQARRDDAMVEARYALQHLRAVHVARARRCHHDYLRALKSLRDVISIEVAP